MAMADGLLSSLTRIVERSASWIRPSDHGPSPTLSRVPSLQDHLGRLRRMLPRIRAVLDDAEEMEIQDESVKLWLHEIKDVAYDADDVLDEYEYEILRAKVEATGFQRSQPEHIPEHGGDVVEVSNLGIPSSSSSSMDASFWGKIACRVEEITERFNEISKQRDALHLREGVGERRFETTEARPSSTPLMDGPNMYGREGDIKELMSMIFSPSEHNPSVIAVVGMGGVGKTTLVQHIYNDQAVCEHFELRGWVCVSDDFEVPKLTKRIIEAITKERCDLTELSVIQEKLMKELSGRRFLLVLDDLWNQRTDLWLSLRAPLRYGSQGSLIITTTRSENVAKTTQTMPCLGIGCLPFDDCWAIFQEHAFGSQAPREDEDFLEVGKEIVRKCKGLPLACTTIGGLLRYESDIDKWNAVLRSEVWDSHGSSSRSTILPTLMLSYIHLPTNLKRCFAYCAVFPKDFSFTKDQLVRLWMAQGFIQFHRVRQFEETGTQYFDELLQRSFFQTNHEYSAEHEQGFVMHDLIHDLAVSVSAGECSVINNEETWRPSHGSQFLRHTAFVPYGSDVTVIFQSLCDDGLSGLRSLLLLRRTDVWVKKEVVNQIPDAVMQELVCLRALDLSYIRLSHLPGSIGNLKHLRYLDLSRTRLEVFPESLCHLYLIQTMDLSYSRIHCLPHSISNLRQLRYLSLCHTGLRSLPGSVGGLINLRTLDLAYTGISNLPQSVGNLRHLIFLDLSGTEIRWFPELVCMLCNLRTLNLNNVSIYELPESIGNLQNLRHLDLNETGIETLPESICNLRYLQMLNLSFSRLRKLPKCIGNLGRLSHLDLSSTRVKWLPKSICGISNLQSLSLKSCSNLRRLPNQMGSLTNLQHLDFNAQHVFMPRGIGRLTNLRTLPAFNVGIGHGGCSIEELTDLTELRGSLQISGLRYVEKPEHADMVNLRGKTQIDKLTLNWECVHRKRGDGTSISSTSSSEAEESSANPEIQRQKVLTDLGEQRQYEGSALAPVTFGDTSNGGIWEVTASEAEQSDVLKKFPRKVKLPGSWWHVVRRRQEKQLNLHYPGGEEDLVLSQSSSLRVSKMTLQRWIRGDKRSDKLASEAKRSSALEKLQTRLRHLQCGWHMPRRRGGVKSKTTAQFYSEGSHVERETGEPPNRSQSGGGRIAHRKERAFSSSPPSEDEESGVLEKLQPASGSRDRIASQAEQLDVLEKLQSDSGRGGTIASEVEQPDVVEKLQSHNISQSRIDPHAKHSDILEKPRPHSETGCGRIASQTQQSDVLEKLQPPSDLTVLEVLGYGGSVFPRWMEDPSFGRLVHLLLQGCANCTHLPALGQLPSLKQLAIIDAPAVERLGPEFRFGKEGEGRRGTAFPSLEVMTVRGMSKWVEWGGVENGDFPRLVSLEIIDCPLLRGDLPNSRYSLPMLKVLRLSDCPGLVYVPLHNMPNLRTAVLEGCKQLVHIDFGNLPSSSDSPTATTSTPPEVALGFLRIAGCPQARFLLEEEGHLLPQTLTYLYIENDCHCLLEWCQGDGSAWLARIPYSKLTFEGGKLCVRYQPENV